MPATIVCVFADRSTTRSAIDQLVRGGIPASRIKLHEHTPTARNASLIAMDEFVSGGFFANLTSLFDGLLEHRVADGDAATYADVVRSEGTLVSIEVHGQADVQRCEGLLRAAGALHVATLPEDDTVSFRRLYPESPDGFH
jgi:hypothetical protein